ncbi:MAG: hypothetical protein E7169_01440 [Firmicutes bacterium]|nr:hypothetical protein [Bacillota bacterium]
MEIVCQRCGTLNNEKGIMCMRCGEKLETDAATKLDKFKGRIISEKLVAFLYIIIFTAYLYFINFYFSPWFNSGLFKFGNSFIFEYYNDPNLTNITLHVIYVMVLFIINYIATIVILELILRNKLIKREKVNMFCFSVGIYIFISVAFVTFIKFKFEYIYILKHLISFMAICPYINRKMMKRSI